MRHLIIGHYGCFWPCKTLSRIVSLTRPLTDKVVCAIACAVVWRHRCLLNWQL